MTTPAEARDLILGVFKGYWDTTGYAVVWDDNEAKPPTTEAPWARVTVRHFDGGQRSLADATGRRKYENSGTVFVQLFTPAGQGLFAADTLVLGVLTAYKNASGAVWYRNQRFREVGRDGAFQQINCMIDFLYDDVT